MDKEKEKTNKRVFSDGSWQCLDCGSYHDKTEKDCYCEYCFDKNILDL